MTPQRHSIGSVSDPWKVADPSKKPAELQLFRRKSIETQKSCKIMEFF